MWKLLVLMLLISFNFDNGKAQTYVCNQPMIKGLCRAYIESDYVVEDGNTLDLEFSGSQGQLPEHIAKCLAIDFQLEGAEQAGTRYGYSQDRGYCVKFIYGGCGANDNNFETLRECVETCP